MPAGPGGPAGPDGPCVPAAPGGPGTPATTAECNTPPPNPADAPMNALTMIVTASSRLFKIPPPSCSSLIGRVVVQPLVFGGCASGGVDSPLAHRTNPSICSLVAPRGRMLKESFEPLVVAGSSEARSSAMGGSSGGRVIGRSQQSDWQGRQRTGNKRPYTLKAETET